MTRVIHNPKDTIDECVESVNAARTMIGVDSVHARSAGAYLAEAVANLQKARAEYLRIRG